MLLNSSFVSLPTFFKPQQLQRTNLPSSNGSLLRCYATSSNISQRKSANYKPNIWNHDTLLSLKHSYADVKYVNRSRSLQEEVRRMINEENEEILELIENVKRLGLSYHFEKEIKEALDRFLSLEKYSDTVIEKDLHETALKFKLLREYGYDVSPDIFERFKDQSGNFKTCLVKDIKGMLSLYDASFLSYEGELILDEANSFSSFHLKQGLHDDISDFLIEQVNHSLELPLHRRFQRLEARWYIELYGKTKDANNVLLEAAKLDFNIVQSNLQLDLIEMSTWWKGMGLSPRLRFGRDRLMECFFWAAGMAPLEPKFSDLRKGLTKVCSLITLIDDIYDVYGTLDELELFTTAVESWDINAVKTLPKYMKIFFLALYNTINGLAYDAFKENGYDILPYLVKAWSNMLKAFLQEARWCDDEHMPKFDEYLNNAWMSVSGVVLLTHTYFLLNHTITKEGLEHLENCHLLFQRPCIIFRLCNDLATSSAELQRGEATNSSMCYMKEYGVNEMVAHKYIHNFLNETWKKMNKDRVTYSTLPKYFLETLTNLARISHCTYQYGDGHGALDTISQNRLKALILEPIN
ncbi:tricyclene synthase TPS4, chloroplastic-like [Vicia villosa]|uniref:tricyclene synthase TPS4, chloroplastic-like n=1 Tax=Vicia villosa TaxID=3911 RepID=UPI00273A7927|nr:tricyclene synthase TPS4, chloroplastic-like [Vicia villosa]